MSTKIYNGYRLKPMTLLQLDRNLSTFRRLVEQLAQRLYFELQAHVASNIIDRVALGLSIKNEVAISTCKYTDGYSPLVAATQTALDHLQRARESSRRDPVWDFDCELVLFPMQDCILATLYTEKHEFTRLWESLPYVQSFPYWDNMDQPDGMSWAEWKKRGKIWERAVWNHHMPSLSGFTVTCVTEYLEWADARHLYVHQPSYKDRVATQVYALLLESYRARTERELDFGPWTKSAEGKRVAAEAASVVRTTLRKRLRMQDFKQRLGRETLGEEDALVSQSPPVGDGKTTEERASGETPPKAPSVGSADEVAAGDGH